jgi:hypothetical protein
MKNSKETNKTKCAHCQGRGELYNGCPDAMAVESEQCDACKGRGWTGAYPSSPLRVSTMTPLERTFVLADFFTVEVHSTAPLEVLEADEGAALVVCPCCHGEKWLETDHNGWTSALFADSRRAHAFAALNNSYKACGRCSGTGEVLDVTLNENNEFYENYPTPSLPELPEPLVQLLAA